VPDGTFSIFRQWKLVNVLYVPRFPWIPKEVAVRGFVYDVSSGRLREIK